MSDRATQTTLQYTAAVVSEACPVQADKCSTAQNVQIADAAGPVQCAPVLQRSIYSGWSPPGDTECPEKTAPASVEKSVSVNTRSSATAEKQRVRYTRLPGLVS